MTTSGERSGAGSRGFPSPLEVSIPPGCQGWEDFYPAHALFSEDRRAFDESRFWFQDGLHYAEPYYPFDALYHAFAMTAINQATARLFVVPSSLGMEYRLLNGYVYLSGNAVTEAARITSRAEMFARRGGYYYEHWDEIDARWQTKVVEAISELEMLQVPELPEFEDEAIVTEARGWGSSHALLLAYDRLLEGFDRICHYHFELVGLGYGAYLVLDELCREAFPGISDQVVAKMVAGIDILTIRPDEELKRLARLALELRVARSVMEAGDEEGLRSSLAGSKAGQRWLTDFDQTKNPWFNFSYGNGLYHHHRSWMDDTTLPVATIASYVGRLEAGEDISRPRESVIAERDRITDEYRSLLAVDTRHAFDEQLALARTVFPHIENHNFYIDHWYHSVFWNKVREFGALLARNEFLADQEDVFFLRHDEVRAALEELRLAWSGGGAGPTRGPRYWPPLVERRKSIYEAMREWSPPPALGRVPDSVTDPVLIMHWGITSERVRAWLLAGEVIRELTGLAGSPGIVEGRARTILTPDQLGNVQEGEILVAPCTSPSWTPVFGKIAGAVLDAGGAMCHAAIVAREYGLPTVVGVGTATTAIKTGDRIRVDGGAGVVTILD
jgi:phosphohistidine swiveling domain-containing protein